MENITKDAFFDGALWVHQPKEGFRSGQDGLLLAASVASKTRGTVLDFGTGSGLVSLAMAYRCRYLDIVGIDYDVSLLKLAQTNAKLNGFEQRLTFKHIDIMKADPITETYVDGVVMNPPFYRQGAERTPHNEARSRAMMGSKYLIERWVTKACACLNNKGFLAIMLRPDWLDALLRALPDVMGAIQILPIHSALDLPARRVLIKTIKGRRTPPVLLPPLITNLDGPHGEWMNACLRSGAGLDQLPSHHAAFFCLASPV